MSLNDGRMPADVSAILGSIDIAFGEIDRQAAPPLPRIADFPRPRLESRDLEFHKMWYAAQMTTQSKPRRMTVPEFLAWAAAQPRGRYELVRGEAVAMAPERLRHLVVKGAVFVALRDAVRRAGLPCMVFPDGATVVIDNEHSREPDAAVQCGAAFNPDSMILEAPLLVVEVTSPSSERDDTGEKLVEYFSVLSIHHYLIVNPIKKVVVHHARSEGDDIATRIASSGEIDLTPPGMTVPVAELLPEIS